MYVQIWIIKQLGLFFGGEKVLRRMDISSWAQIRAPGRALAVSIFGRPVCSPVDGLYRWARQQPRRVLVGRQHTCRGVHRTTARLPRCIIWSSIKIVINIQSKTRILQKAQSSEVHPHLMLLIPLKDHDALCDQQNQGLFCKMMACIPLGLCLYLDFKTNNTERLQWWQWS